jgi:hypothetical protein
MRESAIFGTNALALWLLAATSTAAVPVPNADIPTPVVVVANDNHTPAGQLRNGILRLQLELRAGRWYPEDEGGPYRDIYAFAAAQRAQRIAQGGNRTRPAQPSRCCE